MKKTFSVVLMIALVAGAFAAAPAEAKKKKRRSASPTAEAPYSAPAFGTASSPAVCSPALGSCGEFAVGTADKYMKVEILDQSGTPTAFNVASGHRTGRSGEQLRNEPRNVLRDDRRHADQARARRAYHRLYLGVATPSARQVSEPPAPSRRRSRTFRSFHSRN